MFENLNRSKMSFEQYVDLKGKTIVKSYTERFRRVDKFMYAFSWFGNGVSIFLAFFFLQTLFYASFSSIGISMWITLGIIFFLTMFELLKRYILSMFSLEIIKQKFRIFRGNMLTFILATGILITGSFYFSLNGAKVFVDNQKFFEKQTKQIVTSKIDSLTMEYDNDIEVYVNENNNLRIINDTLRVKLSKTPLNYRTTRKEYQDIINTNTSIINSNQIRIDKIEAEKQISIVELKAYEDENLSSNLNENKKNKMTFIIISSIIELIIIFGIYFDKFYEYRSLLDYEESVINTSEFKMWYKYNYLLELIYNSTKDIGDKIPSTDNLIELAKIGKSPITSGEFEKFIKLLYHLDLIAREGNKRILNSTEEEGKKTLRTYFNIK